MQTQDSQPLVSIIVPAYNRADIIAATLQSVQKQTYQNWECLIVDDGSADNTKEVIQQFSQQDTRFRYLNNTRQKGAPGARNTGMSSANGTYIMFLDSDDLLLPLYIENHLLCFQKNLQTDVVIGLQKKTNNGEVTAYVNAPSSIHPLVRFYSLYPNMDIPWINSTLIKKSFLTKHNISWDESMQMYQDIQFNIGLLSYNPVITWTGKEYDSLWVFNSTAENIGRVHVDFMSKYGKLIEVYWHTIHHAVIDKPLLKNVKKQYSAFLLWFSFEMFRSKEFDSAKFWAYLHERSFFNRFDKFLLKKYQSLPGIFKRNIFQKAVSRFITWYLSASHQPIVREGCFLKYTTLPGGANIL